MQESHKYFQEIAFQSMDHSCKCSALLLHISSVTSFPSLRTLAMVQEDAFLLSTWGQGAVVLGLELHKGQPPQSGQPEQTFLRSASVPDSPGASPCGLLQEQAKRQIRPCWDPEVLDAAGQTGKCVNPESCSAKAVLLLLCSLQAFCLLASLCWKQGRTQCCLPQLTFANSEVGPANSLLHYVRRDSAHFPSQQLPLLPRQLFH